jgi:hypothetical protein
VEHGTGPWTGRSRGGQLGSPGSCPRTVHELSTDPSPFIHRPGSNCPQSCPQMWVKCARTTTQGDRSVTPGCDSTAGQSLDIPRCRWDHTQGHRIGVNDDHQGGWRCVECCGGHDERPRVAEAVEERVPATDRQRACGQLGDSTRRRLVRTSLALQGAADVLTQAPPRTPRVVAGAVPGADRSVGLGWVGARIVAASHPLPRHRSPPRAVAAVVRGVTVAVLV